MRHGRKTAPNVQRFQRARALDLDSKVTREVVVCPAEPAGAWAWTVAEELEKGPAVPAGYRTWGPWRPTDCPMGGPGRAHHARPGHKRAAVDPNTTSRWTPHSTVTCPNGQTLPMVPGKDAQFQPVPAMLSAGARSGPPPAIWARGA